MGQVKLSFRATTGHQMVVTRNMQVTVKKNTVQFKTLEGVIQTKTKDGERTSVSSRVAELDQVMPQYLGVSKAVLDSVIFCHQDESLWPLSEPAALKKKFDEIFEALKYTKAIDNIKALRKAKNDELKRFKEAEVSSKNLKNLGDKAEKQSRELDAEIKQLKDEITELNTKTKEAEEKYRDAFDRETQYERVINQLDDHRTREGWVQAQVTKLGENLQVRSESDEWLQSELDHNHERIIDHENNKTRQNKRYQSLERNLKHIEERLSRKHTEAGKYEEQRANHEQQIELRKALIRETSRHHKIRGYDTDLDDERINEYLNKISKLCKDQIAAVEKARCETEGDTEKAQNVLNKLGEQSSVTKENKNSVHASYAANQTDIGKIQSHLNSIEIDEGGKAILEANIEDLEVRLTKARDDSRKGSWDSKISEAELQLRRVREERQQVNNDLIQANRQAGELARLALLKDEMADRRRKLDTMKGVHNDKLRSLVGRTWEPSRLDVDFHNVINERSRQVKEAERHRDLVSRGLEHVEYKLSNAKLELMKADKELATCVKKLTDNVDGEPKDYLDTLSELQRQRDLLKADFDNFGNMKKYFSQAIQKAQGIHPKAPGKHVCNLCERAFHGKEESDFIKKMQEKIENETAEQVAQDLRDLEDELRNAKEVGPSHDTWLRLVKTELPRLQGTVESLGAERETIVREIESHDKTVADRENALRDAELLAKPVALITRYHQEMTNFNEQREELTAKQTDAESSRTLDDIQDQLKIVDGKIQGMDTDLSRFRAEKERAHSLITSLELSLSKATNSLSTANYQLERKQDHSKRIEEFKEANRGYQNTIKRLDTQLKELAQQIAQEETKIEEVRQRGRAKVSSMQQEASSLESSLRKLDFAAQNIKRYIEDCGPADLARCRREIDCVEQEISKTKDEQKQVTVYTNKIQQELSSQDHIKRTITDNLEYRRNLRELDEIKSEIATLSEQNADADRRHWHKQAAHWRRIFDESSSDKTRKLGTATAKDNQLAGLIRDWNVDYKDAAYNFKKAHIEVEVGESSVFRQGVQLRMIQTTKAAVEDLGRYASALDK